MWLSNELIRISQDNPICLNSKVTECLRILSESFKGFMFGVIISTDKLPRVIIVLNDSTDRSLEFIAIKYLELFKSSFKGCYGIEVEEPAILNKAEGFSLFKSSELSFFLFNGSFYKKD